MLGRLIHKEILDQILSLRFVILAAIGAFTIWLSLYDGYANYQARLKDYHTARTMTEERLRQYQNVDGFTYRPLWEFSGVGFEEHKPPTPLSIFARGLEMTLGRSIPTGYTKQQRLRQSPVEAEPTLGVFPPLDLGLVVQLVLSLFVLLLSYDAICGEKEGGTLRLISSFSLPRSQLLIGKSLGVLLPVLAVFGLPLLLGISSMLLVGGIQLSGDEWIRLGLVLLLFGVYLGVMVLAGVAASSISYKSATSFILLLTFWVVTVVVMPRISLIVADGILPAPSTHEFQAKQKAMQRQTMLKRRAKLREWEGGWKNWWESPEGREAHTLKYTEIRDEAQGEGRIERDRLESAFRNQYQNRLNLAVVIARISPAFAFKNAAIRLTGTGVARHERFNRGFIAYHRGTFLDWAREREDRNGLSRSNPDKYGKPDWNINGLPRFLYREEWADEDVQTFLVDACVLTLWGLLFFATAFMAVSRYDLR
jgi:ABC-type transport system involved in multi-copper enzyme maturation permease subunit